MRRSYRCHFLMFAAADGLFVCKQAKLNLVRDMKLTLDYLILEGDLNLKWK